eukprot:scaffold6997_cov417-Prasinococcus_capsulatus_cf.AAC.4
MWSVSQCATKAPPGVSPPCTAQVGAPATPTGHSRSSSVWLWLGRGPTPISRPASAVPPCINGLIADPCWWTTTCLESSTALEQPSGARRRHGLLQPWAAGRLRRATGTKPILSQALVAEIVDGRQ